MQRLNKTLILGELKQKPDEGNDKVGENLNELVDRT